MFPLLLGIATFLQMSLIPLRAHISTHIQLNIIQRADEHQATYR